MVERLRQLNYEKVAQQEKKAKEYQASVDMLDLRRDVVESFKYLVDYLERRTSKTQVVNQLREIGTPDALKVVDAVNQLHTTLKGKDVDLTPLTEAFTKGMAGLEEAVKNIPKTEIPEQIDNTKQFNALTNAIKAVEGAIKAQETNVEAPVVNVEAPNVTVDAPDLKPFVKELTKAFDNAISGIKYPELPRTDLTKLEKEAEKQTKLLKEIKEKPVGGGGGGATGRTTPYENSTGIPMFVQLTDDGNIPVEVAQDTYSAVTVDATASGDTTIVAITNSARLYYVSLSANGANSADVTAIVKIGSSEKFKVSLKAGSIFARNIGAGRHYLTGTAGDDIIVNLSTAQTVHVSVEYEDI